MSFATSFTTMVGRADHAPWRHGRFDRCQPRVSNGAAAAVFSAMHGVPQLPAVVRPGATGVSVPPRQVHTVLVAPWDFSTAVAGPTGHVLDSVVTFMQSCNEKAAVDTAFSPAAAQWPRCLRRNLVEDGSVVTMDLLDASRARAAAAIAGARDDSRNGAALAAVLAAAVVAVLECAASNTGALRADMKQ